MSAPLTKPADETIEAYPAHLRDRAIQLVPDPSIAEAYTNRLIEGHRDFDFFDSAQRLFHNVLFRGPTGSGKTTAARAYASYLQVPFTRVEFHKQLAIESVFGRNHYRDGQTIFEPGDLYVTLQGPSVNLLDEISNINAGSFAGFHGMLDAGGTIFVPQTGSNIFRHDDARIFAAYNPKYSGNQQLSEAGRNRFAYPMEWGYDDDVENDRIGTYTPTLLTIVRKLRTEERIHSDVGTNAMEEFIHVTNDMSIDAAIYLFVNRFDEGERWAVKNVLDAERVNIADELGVDS